MTPPKQKWESIMIDFMMAFPIMFSGHEVVWVIVDRLTKSAYFIPLRVGCYLEKMTNIYIREIVRLHGVSMDIVSNKYPQFVTRF